MSKIITDLIILFACKKTLIKGMLRKNLEQ